MNSINLAGMYYTCFTMVIGEFFKNENALFNASYSTPLGCLVSHEMKRSSMDDIYHALASEGAVAISQPHQFSTTRFYGWTNILNVLSWSDVDHLATGSSIKLLLLLYLLIHPRSIRTLKAGISDH